MKVRDMPGGKACKTADKVAVAARPEPSQPRNYEVISHLARSEMAKLTFGVAPTVLAAAFYDLAAHLTTAPGKQLDLAHPRP